MSTAPTSSPVGTGTGSGSLLRVQDLHVSFKAKARGKRVMAVNGVSFDVDRGETVGLVGESGSGKSTIARAIMRLVPSDRGSVHLDGTELLRLSHRELAQHRQHVQMVFQDPYSSMNPSMVISEIIGEPLAVQAKMPRDQRDQRVAELLEAVGLSARHRERYPYEFSGGQRQRIAIARALANHPKLVILDEAVSALDVSTQNQIINLLEDLQERLGVSFLFIAHDLAVVRHIARRTVVLYLGKVMEEGPSERIFSMPAHPYSHALLSAVPVPNPATERTRKRIVLLGEPPDPTNIKPGCPFVARCRFAMDICSQTMPEPTPVEGGGVVACHLQTSGPTLAGRPISALDA